LKRRFRRQSITSVCLGSPKSTGTNQICFSTKPFTAEECAQALKEALDFVAANPQACPANSVIIYAWNEFDEGGWLCPTLGANGKPDTSRIEAVGKILREWKPQAQK
jgi:hypothetical protein